MKKWKCTVCGYLYNPEVGSPKTNIKKGVKFLELPSNWNCPICNSNKDKFEPLLTKILTD